MGLPIVYDISGEGRVPNLLSHSHGRCDQVCTMYQRISPRLPRSVVSSLVARVSVLKSNRFLKPHHGRSCEVYLCDQ